jgi:hypothetical protein
LQRGGRRSRKRGAISREPSLVPIHGESLERVKGIEPSSSAWKAVGKPNKINGD